MSINVADVAVRTIEGTEKTLAEYANQVVLVVNVASRCGYTPQYTGLEQLHETYADQGLRVLGFPCNDFGGQEPGSNEEILNFCTTNYGVKFELFDKVHAKGLEQHPLYAKLTQTDPAGDVAWNFEKFLIDKQGNVVGRYKSGVGPNSPELTSAIKRELAR